jgi:hypothetical protein
MSLLSLLLLLSLGEARLVHLVIEDQITARARRWTVGRWGQEGAIPYLVHCSWCTGLWASTALCTFSWAVGFCSAAEGAILIPAVAYAGAIIRSLIEE